ncbi:MAG: rhomboid family intramembrane serine protease [Solobacterium sp.]|nr:rhomboid family intramembrane serine protease [Solobacterium sp.]
MKRITWNSPVVLSFALISGLVLALNYLTGGASNRLLFMVYKGSLRDPLFYVRLFTHVLGHADITHYTNNMILFLMLGPLLEEKYGSKRLLEIILLTAFITGVIQVLLPFNTALLGASGVDFAFIILASITGTHKSNEIPLTLIIVAVIYIGQQVMEGLLIHDNISQLTHIIGGLVGAVYGLVFRS